MDPVIFTLAIILSYLLGSISFGRLFMQVVKPKENLDDVEMKFKGMDEGIKLSSVGGNTISMKLGARAGCAVGLLDILKAFIPTLVFRILYPQEPYFIFAALAAFIGHNWPIYYRFKGGRGISPFYGGLFAIDPLGAVVVAATSLVLGTFILKDMLVAYTGGVVLVIFWFLGTKYNNPLFVYYIGYAILINILFIVAMLPELRQIITLRKKYGKGDVGLSMEAFPMGQQMQRMMNKFSANKKGNKQPHPEDVRSTDTAHTAETGSEE